MSYFWWYIYLFKQCVISISSIKFQDFQVNILICRYLFTLSKLKWKYGNNDTIRFKLSNIILSNDCTWACGLHRLHHNTRGSSQWVITSKNYKNVIIMHIYIYYLKPRLKRYQCILWCLWKFSNMKRTE